MRAADANRLSRRCPSFLTGALSACRRGSSSGRPILQLLLDLLQVVRLGLEIARMRPLETRFQRAADSPIGIAEMIVDGRILAASARPRARGSSPPRRNCRCGNRPSRASRRCSRRPASARRPADHVHAVVEIDALIDPGIAEIIQHLRLIGKKLQRLLQIGFRLRPLLASARSRCRGNRRSPSSTSPDCAIRRCPCA